MEVIISNLEATEEAPLDLLLLADPSVEIVNEYFKKGQVYIASKNKELIGIIVLVLKTTEIIEIVNVAVREDCQGKGIGKKLIYFAISKAREQNVKIIEIGTGNSSIGQLLLYQKCGFRITGIDRDYFVRKNYKEEIFENGIQCRDMIRLSLDL